MGELTVWAGFCIMRVRLLTAEVLGMSAGTTRSDEIRDNSVADMGYHYWLANRADIKADGRVDVEDFVILGVWWGQSDCGSCGGAELTDDGDVGLADLGVFCDSWLEGAGP